MNTVSQIKQADWLRTMPHWWRGLGRGTQGLLTLACAAVVIWVVLRFLVLPPVELLLSAPSKQAELDRKLADMRDWRSQSSRATNTNNESAADRLQRLTDVSRPLLGDDLVVSPWGADGVSIEAVNVAPNHVVPWLNATGTLLSPASLAVSMSRVPGSAAWQMRIQARWVGAGVQ